MKELLLLLQRVLEKEIEIYDEFLNLANLKNKVLIEQNIEKLDTITKKEEEKILELKIYEEKREEIIKKIKEKIGLKEGAKLEDILKETGEKCEDLIEIRDKLKSKILEVKGLNDENMKMIENTLSIINKTMKTLGELTKTGKSYTKEGKVEKTGEETRTFDTEV
ncbi:MAG: flagellar protein FlgN [Candidatus Hydrogenedentota bacterium]